jgi:hypothetical protein
METNELLYEAIKSLITEEQIDNAIDAAVRERMNYRISQAIEMEASEIAKEYCDKKIIDVLDSIFGKQVNTDDGFGYARGYKSFEEYVKEYIGKNVRNQYDMERKVRRMVDEKITAICKKVVEQNNADLADKAMRMLAGESQ